MGIVRHIIKVIALFLATYQLHASGDGKDHVYYGTIGTYPIEVTLNFGQDNNISGHYMYTKYQKQMPLVGKYSGVDIEFSVIDSRDQIVEKFSGKYSTDEINGTWIYKDKKLPFALMLDPFDDNKITCKEMHAMPERVFDTTYGIDFGAGRYSPTELEDDCEGGLRSLGFLDGLYNLAEAILNDGGCDRGSTLYVALRYYQFDLIALGIAPGLSRFSYTERYEIDSRTAKYFRYWAYQSVSNYELYEQFWHQHSLAYPKLISHFQHTLRIPEEKAKKYARNALNRFMGRAAGSLSINYSDSKIELSPLQKTIADTASSYDDIKNQLVKTNAQKTLNQALKIAVLLHRSTDVIDLLMKQGAEIDSGYESALFFALRDISMVKYLLAKGAQVDYANTFGKTVLFYAIQRNDLELVKLLVENGANVNRTYVDKQTIEKLGWNENKTPFFMSVNCLQHTKRTPLMHAAQNGNLLILKYLIEMGAKIDAIDEMEYNALDYAHLGKNEDNIEYLQSIGLTTARYYWQ